MKICPFLLVLTLLVSNKVFISTFLVQCIFRIFYRKSNFLPYESEPSLHDNTQINHEISMVIGLSQYNHRAVQ